MIIHNYGKYPEGYHYPYGTISELDSWDIERLERLGLDEVWYWYAYGDYEGSGQMLMRKDNLYDVHDMGHCSCFGPVEEVNFVGRPFEELEASLSEAYYKNEVRPLMEMAGGNQLSLEL